MKNAALILGFGLFSILWGCKEEPPYINYDEPKTTIDTTWVKPSVSDAQVKQVLLEDVTGVKCVNCPDAAKIAHDLSIANPDKINIVSMHPNIAALNFFCAPIKEPGHTSKYDFRTQAAADICTNIIGVPNTLPKGGINRRKFSDQTDILMDRTNWTAKANDELAVPTPVNINLALVTEINGNAVAANEIWIDVTIEYTAAVSDTNYLTIVLLEDSIIDVQEYTDYSQPVPVAGYNNNYVHMHVMRDAMTASTGDLINKKDAPLVPGRVFLKRYKYTVTNSLWKRKQMHAVAYVHKNSAEKNVIQSNHVSLH
jgi:hypothetical protein